MVQVNKVSGICKLLINYFASVILLLWLVGKSQDLATIA